MDLRDARWCECDLSPLTDLREMVCFEFGSVPANMREHARRFGDEDVANHVGERVRRSAPDFSA